MARKKTTAEKATPVVEEKAVIADEVEVSPATEETSAPVAEEKASAEEKKSTVKKTTAKKSTAKKTATKTTAKTTAKKTTAKKKADAPAVDAVEEKKPVEKKTTAKKTASVNVFFQYQGTESAELIEKAKELSGVKSPKSVNLYIKPEENMVYYVVDDIAGGFAL